MLLIAAAALPVGAEPIPVIQRQGAIHGFLLLLDENGKEIAVGEQTNVATGNAVRARLTFQFRDGSIDDETAVFRQGSVFQLVRDHHVQKGPSFAKASDVTIDLPAGKVTWIDDGKPKSKQMKLPADLVNGIFSLTVENFRPKATELDVSYLAVDSKPRIVKVKVTRDGKDKTQFGTTSREADRFNLHFDLGGIAGVIAPVIGKQPPDIKLWVSSGAAPIFLRMTGPLYEQGPVWNMVLTAPTWAGEAGAR